MPISAVRIIRLSLAYFILGTTVGALLLVEKGLGLLPWTWILRPAHAEVLLYGWFMHLIMGVGSWILPRPRTQRSHALLLAAVALLNGGIWLAAAGRMVADPVIHAVGRGLDVAAAVCFALYIWPRISVVVRR